MTSQTSSRRRSPNASSKDRARPDLPNLLIDSSDLPKSARELRDHLTQNPRLFVRGGELVRVVCRVPGMVPSTEKLGTNEIILEAHDVCQPTRLNHGTLEACTLPKTLAQLYLSLRAWNLPELVGIATAPLLDEDGAIRTVEGYDSRTRLWCANIPTMQVPKRPTLDQAKDALHLLREAFRTIPYADSPRIHDGLGLELVDVAQPPGQDESAFLTALMTAVSRPCLWLAPGLALRAPEMSGSGTGKGLLLRCICAIAFGQEPSAITMGHSSSELDKRIVSAVTESGQTLFLDNCNRQILKNQTLMSVLTERPSKLRRFGSHKFWEVNSAMFVCVTGNALQISEDLVRRFMFCELDARCENPELRPFQNDLLADVKACRSDLLTSVLTIWRWGRQNKLTQGRPLGSYPQWCSWCRDPLLALGCRDVVGRLEELRTNDPVRIETVELFNIWWQQHRDDWMASDQLGQPIKAFLGVSRQARTRRLDELASTRLGGFVFERYKDPNHKWSPAKYRVVLA